MSPKPNVALRGIKKKLPEAHVYHRSFSADEHNSLAILARKIRPNSTVLDLGTGPGVLGRYLKEAKGCTVDGVDFVDEQIQLAKPSYRKIIREDLEKIQLCEHFPLHAYDYVICADTLEHLSNPGKILDQVADLLADGGRILLSIPNISYIGVISDLLSGDFRYRIEGLLDKTHLRFFTRTSLYEFLGSHGIMPLSVDNVYVPVQSSEFDVRLLEQLPPAIYEFLISLPDSNVYQFIIEAVSKGPSLSLPVEGKERPLAIENTTFVSKLYWAARGQSFVEDRSIFSAGQAKDLRQRLCFPLPLNQPIHRLRLDPADRTGLMNLHAIKLQDGQERVLWAWDGTRAALEAMASQQLLFAEPTSDAYAAQAFATGLDPWIILDIPPSALAAAQHGGELVLELSRPGMDDYWNLVREFLTARNLLEKERQQFLEVQFSQNAELHGLRERLALIESSIIWQMTRRLIPWSNPTWLMTEQAASIPAIKRQLIQLVERARNPKAKNRARVIDVIIPVYGGAEETRRCIESVLASPQKSQYQLIVINDASPDPEQVAWLSSLAEKRSITLLNNPENLGFVGTVNRGMALNPDHDVVLLNSDTEVASNWLDRLVAAAYKAVNIGTVTPFSNNATICSYPSFCKDNPLPAGLSVSALDKLFAEVNAGAIVDLPTAVGFCMYIRRDCLQETGLFSVEHFGKGYGEENDFCARAMRRGWRNVLSADTFVYHSGGASFADTQNPRKQKALETLRKLHPDYAERIQRHIGKDPARPFRLAVETRRLQRDHRPVLLFITHSLGGGTEKHVLELAHLLEEKANVLVLRPGSDGQVEIKWTRTGADLQLKFDLEKDYQILLDWLRCVGVSRIHVHHTKSVPSVLWELPKDLQVPLDFSVHDFYTFCPQISLTGVDSRYCGEPDEDGCNRCLRITPAPGGIDIQAWRYDYQALLRQTDRIFCPSQDTAARIKHRFPFASVIATPHPDLDHVELPTPVPAPMEDRPLRIAVLGGLSGIKGADVLEAVGLMAKQFDAPLEFHLIGQAYRGLVGPPKSCLSVHGSYQDEDLPQIFNWLKPDVVWFPAVWPETYSYTLSACLIAGLPVVAPNLGAFPERLAGRAWSFIEPWDRSIRDWCNFFVRLRRDHFMTGRGPTPPPGESIHSDFSYERDYLPRVSKHSLRLAKGAAVQPSFFLRHAAEQETPTMSKTVRLAVIDNFNRARGLPLFHGVIETIPKGWRNRAYTWLAAGSRP